MAREIDTAAKDEEASWGTLEELLLACAVNRHGTKRWDSIAMEVRKRSLNLPALSPQNCKRKYNDLRRRFEDEGGGDESEMNGGGAVEDMVDELRKLRVAELRREVQERDDSIVSLQLKVRRLEDERERSLKEEEEGGVDLEKDPQGEADGGVERRSPAKSAGKSASGDDSERGDGSFNESNSTNQKCEDRGAAGPKPETDEPVENLNLIQTGSKPDGGDDDTPCGGPRDDISADQEESAAPAGGEKSPEAEAAGGASEPNERCDSAAESKREGKEEAMKQNSDVQSSASLSKKRRKRRRRGGVPVVSSSGEEPEAEEVSPATKPISAVKSQPLVRLLGIIRSHKLGSAFERRLRSQESERYKKLVRQHMDLETVQSRLDKGVYSDCIPMFFRDLLLIFNNGVVFFRKNSAEQQAARDLRTLVSKELAQIVSNRVPKDDPPNPEPRPNSLLRKPINRPPPPAPVPTPAPPIAVFRKRGSGTPAAKASQPATPEIPSKKPTDKRRAFNIKSKPPEGKNSSDSSLTKKAAEERGKAAKRTAGLAVERPVSGKRSQRKRSAAEERKLESSSNSETSSSSDEEDSEPPPPRANNNKKEKAVISAAEAVKKKKAGMAEFLKRMKQKSPNEKGKGSGGVSHSNAKSSRSSKNGSKNDNDDDDGDDSDDDRESRRREQTRERLARRGSASRATPVAGRDEALNSRSKAKRGVGRPPKKPTPVSSPAPPSKRGRESEGGSGRPGKRSRR